MKLPSRPIASSLFVVAAALLMARPASGHSWTCDSDCNAECGSWDLACRAECFDVRPSCMPKPEALTAFDAQAARLEQRLVERFLLGGYVVSLDAAGGPSHQGDSLLWSSIAMGVMPCSVSRPIEEAIVTSVRARGGALERIDPLPPGYVGNETSRDQETGAFFGFAARAARCFEDAPELRGAWAQHKAYVEDRSGGRLHSGDNPNFTRTPGMSFLFDQISSAFGLRTAPSGDAKSVFEAALVATVEGVSLQGGACYPVHLATLQALTAEQLGRPIKRRVYDQLCRATRSMDLPLTDWYCRRASAESYLRSFVPDRWEYRHQRCGSGAEGADLGPGEASPALDFLILYHLAAGR